MRRILTQPSGWMTTVLPGCPGATATATSSNSSPTWSNSMAPSRRSTCGPSLRGGSMALQTRQTVLPHLCRDPSARRLGADRLCNRGYDHRAMDFPRVHYGPGKGTAFTIHPGVITFQNLVVFLLPFRRLTLDEQRGVLGRRAVCVEYLDFNPDQHYPSLRPKQESVSCPRESARECEIASRTGTTICNGNASIIGDDPKRQ